MALRPGRVCPLSYRYAPDAFQRLASIRHEVLYVVGGLYGNEQALAAVLALHACEPGAVLVFNGDFHWFDLDGSRFERIDRKVLAHVALRGNVETELASEEDSAGCGCGYPDWVPDAEVERSNEIIARLRDSLGALPAERSRLARLPTHVIAEVGGLRIGIVHGDLESLAGWGLAQETASEAARQAQIVGDMRARRLDIVASSHTCLPVLLHLRDGAGEVVVANNGAAGMPNFAGTCYGVATRIATSPCGHTAPLYGVRTGDVYIEALPLLYDQERFLQAFRSDWPEDSAAERSYGRRIAGALSYRLEQALRVVDWTDP
jgi:hypothetical protein